MSIEPQEIQEQVATNEEEALEALYEIEEELKMVAEADIPYSEHAQNGLDALEEAGYDV